MTKTIEVIENLGGKYWEKADKKRYYFNAWKIRELLNIEVSYYKTGNISAIKVNGESWSNSKGNKLMAEIEAAKVYYDMEDGQLHVDAYGRYSDMIEEAARIIRAAIEAASEETITEESKDEQFNAILDNGHTTNGSGRAIFTLCALSDRDLVDLFDVAPDAGYLCEEYGEDQKSIMSITLQRAGLADSDDWDDYLDAVDTLRKRSI